MDLNYQRSPFAIRGDLPLPLDEVHLWFVRPASVRSPHVVAACRQVLSADEGCREARFRFERDRHVFLIAHALVRVALSHYCRIDPGAWTFLTNRHGRPELAACPASPRLCFNLTHTAGLAACAIVRSRFVGVDAEHVDRADSIGAIAPRWFSPSEREEIATLPSHARRGRHVQLWVLREAYAKARGIGLSIPLDHLAFSLTGSDSARLRCPPHVDCAPDRWLFRLVQPTLEHWAAVAIDGGRPLGSPVRVRLLQLTDTFELRATAASP